MCVNGKYALIIMVLKVVFALSKSSSVDVKEDIERKRFKSMRDIENMQTTIATIASVSTGDAIV